jgi:hypothetical protein
MAAAVKDNINKVKDKLDPYLENSPIGPVLGAVEKKLHVGRAFIVLGMLLLFFFNHSMILFV